MITIPPLTGLCGDSATMTTWEQLVMLNFQLMLQEIETNLGIEITIPGLPGVTIPYPAINLLGRDGTEITIPGSRTFGSKGFVGNRFPIGGGGRTQDSTGLIPGFDDFGIPGGTIDIPGADPATLILEWVNTSYQVILEALETVGVFPVVTQIPLSLDLCDDTVVPLINDLINQNNGAIEEAVGAVLLPGCAGFNAIDGPYWVFDSQARGESTLILTPTITSSSWISGPVAVLLTDGGTEALHDLNMRPSSANDIPPNPYPNELELCRVWNISFDLTIKVDFFYVNTSGILGDYEFSSKAEASFVFEPTEPGVLVSLFNYFQTDVGLPPLSTASGFVNFTQHFSFQYLRNPTLPAGDIWYFDLNMFNKARPLGGGCSLTNSELKVENFSSVISQ